jgi:pimeloyl-ACP methyl ester carboxylesterase
MFRSKHIVVVALGLLALPFAALSQTPADSSKGAHGIWLYRYVDHLMSQTMILTFSKQPDDSVVATIDFPEARRQQKFSVVAVDGDKVQIKEYGLSIFEAQVSADGSCLEGKLQMAGTWLPIKLKRLDQSPEFRRPQEPARPYPYDEEEVAFRNDQAKIRLAGTLTLPRGTRLPYPAVVLMSGSGRDERNYLAGGHYPFLVLADYLTRRGIAVLRVDDRGVGNSTGIFSQATTEDLAQDAQAAVDFLKTRKDIDAKRIGLVGHSDGGAGAALLAARSPDIAFLVMLAAPGVPGEQLMLRQTELGLRALGANEHLLQWNVNVQKQVIEVLKRESDAAKADKALMQLVAEINTKLTDDERKQMGVGKTFRLNGVIGSSAWLRYFVNHDPRPTLAKVRCPVLALYGEKDLIVCSKDSAPAIEEALKTGGNKDHTVAQLPGLNHFFQTCKIGAPFEYVLLEETIAPAALELVGDWMAKRTGRRP